MGVMLDSLDVAVNAEADVRGCLMIAPDVTAGFEHIAVDVRLAAADGVDPAQVRMLTSTAERCCVVLQTLRGDMPVTTTVRNPEERRATQ